MLKMVRDVFEIFNLDIFNIHWMIVYAQPKNDLLSFTEYMYLATKIKPAITSFSAGEFCWQPEVCNNPASGKVQCQKSEIHGLPATLHMLRVKLDNLIGQEYKTTSLHLLWKSGPAQRMQFLVLTERSAAFGDENTLF